MNFTLTHLLISKQYSNSPFFSQRQYQNVHFSDLQANHLFSNFFYSSQRIPSFKLYNSKFSRSLSSVLHFESLNINNSQYSETLNIYDTSIVSDCFFEYCNTNWKGGAIDASREEINLTVSRCNFLHCLAQQNGGGVYCKGTHVRFQYSCFANCTAYSFGQAFSAESKETCDLEVNDTIAFRCSTIPKRRNGAAFHSSNVNLVLIYNNHTRCKSLKSSAAMSFFTASFDIVTKCNVINCSSECIMEFTYARDEIKLDHINIIKNTASTNSPIIIISKNTLILECYIEGNTKPFYDRTPGPPLVITFEKCYYDALGIKDENDVVTHQCLNIGANNFPFSISPRGKNYCFYLGKPPGSIFHGFQPLVFLIIIGSVFIAHILFIHPRLIIDVFSQSISGDKKQKMRRRKAAKKAAALLQ